MAGADPMMAGAVPQQGPPVDPQVARIQAASQISQMKQMAQQHPNWFKGGRLWNPR
jgi:hypothetical protein